MARVLGIDPGTGSMDLLALDDSTMGVLYEESIPRAEITANPGILVDRVKGLARELGLDAVAAPSGYGLPPRPPRESLVDYILEATFVNRRDMESTHQIHGLRKVMLELARLDVPVFFTPGVVMLGTVPSYRKMNKIDMGTADKVFTVAAALWAEVEHRGSSLSDASFLVVESGLAYNAVLAVDSGKIVDGVGGTLGGPGFLGLGGMDAETAYVLSSLEPGFSRKRLFEGGVSYLCGIPDLAEFEEAFKRGVKCVEDAVGALAEAIVKDLFQLLPVFRARPRRVYVSGRLFRSSVGGVLKSRIEEALDRYGIGAEVVPVPRLGSRTKEGATGAAILASGYVGGRYKWVVDSLELFNAGGSVFDYILLGGISDEARDYFRSVGRDIL
ncbi:MAG: DUF1464 family protein [Desulfurococcales archaeon]|nr:DUF1464 family protein [Desulfurococcales archaeon]